MIAPVLAAVVLFGLVALLVANFDSLVGSDPDDPLRWILPGMVLLAAAIGAAWAAYLRSNRPDVYAEIGRSAMGPAEDEVAGLDLPAIPR